MSASPSTTNDDPLPSAASLPADPAQLRQMIVELLATLQQERREREQLQHQLDLLLRRLYGVKSEKIDPNQLRLFDEPAVEPGPPPAVAHEEPADDERPRKRRGGGRKPLPEHLPRERSVRDVPEAERCCPECGVMRERIGEEVSEKLDFRPASLFVRQEVRPKYACRGCQAHVVIAPLPAEPIDKGIPGPGLLAFIAVGKYADHLPLHRQAGILRRYGVELSRKTMGAWMAKVAELLGPICREMILQVLLSKVIHTDDTPVRVLDATLPHARTGRFWVYLGDAAHRYVVFDFTPSRKRDGPCGFLKGFEGYLQADAFSGYDCVYAGSSGKIVEVACWAHARRKFHDARTSDASGAHQALAYIRRLYKIERDAVALAEAEAAPLDLYAARLKLRGEQSTKILADFKSWLDQQKIAALPKSPLGKAAAYTLSNWDALNRYVESGAVAIDNNAAERALRAIAVGRRNWTFLGADAGGNTAAVLYSIVQTCQLLGIDPLAYMTDVLDRISTHPAARIAELLPDHWQRLRDEAAATAAAASA
jgi:transposase